MYLFQAAHGWRYQNAPPLPKVFHACPTLMKPDKNTASLKKIQENIWITWHASRVLLSFFPQKSSNFAISRNTDIDWYIISNCFKFFLFFKDYFTKHCYNFGDVRKNTRSRFLKIKEFWNKGYGVITYVHNVTNQFLLYDSNYIADMSMWTKFGNSNISITEFIITSILWGFDQKKHFFEVPCWFKCNHLRQALSMALKL